MPLANTEEPNSHDIWIILAGGAVLEGVVLFFPLVYALHSAWAALARGAASADSLNFKDHDEVYNNVRSLFTVESALDNLDRYKISQAVNQKRKDKTPRIGVEQFFVRWSIRRLLVDEFVLSELGPAMEYVRLAINTMGVVLFSVSSFQLRISFPIAVMNLIIGAVMFADFIFKLFFLPFPTGKNAFAHLLGPSVVLEALSISSILLAGTGSVSYANFTFFRVVPLYQTLVKVYYPAENKIESEEGLDSERIRPFVICWLAYIAALFFSLASVVLLKEVIGVPESETAANWSVSNAIYFMIVTVTTVGYGDFSPVTYPGVITTMLTLVFVLFYVALKVSFLLDVYSVTKSGRGAYARRPGARFVVVLGSPEFAHFSSFLTSFYSTQVLLSTEVVVLSQTSIFSKDQLAKIRRHPKYGSSVKFFVGTVLKEVDRRRISLQKAEAVFAFATGPVKNALSHDARNILRIVCLRDRWARMPLYASHVLPGTLVHMQRSIKSSSSSDRLGDALCQRDLWASFAAVNVRSPGSSTLIANLFSSWDTSLLEDDVPWLREYKLGASNSVEGLIIAEEATSRETIGNLTLELYLERGLLLLAVTDAITKTMFFPNLNPDQPVTAGSIAFLIGSETKIRVIRNTPLFLPADLVSSSRYSSENNTAMRAATIPEQSSDRDVSEKKVGDCHTRGHTLLPDHELQCHTIIAGYNQFSLGDAELVVSKLSDQFYDQRNRNKASDIVVVLPNLGYNEIARFREKHPSARVRVGSALVLDDLLGAGLRSAKSLVVLLELGDHVHSETIDYDSRPVFTMMLIDQIVSACRDDLTIQTFIRDTGAVGLLRSAQPRFLKSMLGAPQDRDMETGPLPMASSLSQCLKAASGSHSGVIDSRRIMNEELFRRPRYAAGEIILTSLTGSYLARDYQVPGSMRLLKILVEVSTSQNESTSCHLHLLGVPKTFSGGPFWKAFKALLRMGALPLGLYRSGRGSMWVPPVVTEEKWSLWSGRRRSRDGLRRCSSTESMGDFERSAIPAGSSLVPGGINTLPWVYTNPESHTVVLESDGIFILATREVFTNVLDEHF